MYQLTFLVFYLGLYLHQASTLHTLVGQVARFVQLINKRKPQNCN
jgi:hypothetical protein